MCAHARMFTYRLEDKLRCGFLDDVHFLKTIHVWMHVHMYVPMCACMCMWMQDNPA